MSSGVLGEEAGWLEGMQRACRKRETTELKANIKMEAADVRFTIEPQIQKALSTNVKRG